MRQPRVTTTSGRLLLLAGLLVLGTNGAARAADATTGLCRVDDEIAHARRAALDDAALTFVRAALGPEPQKAYAMMATEAQSTTSAKALGEQMGALNKTSGAFENLHVVHTYLVTDVGGDAPQTRTICGTLADDKWVAVASRPGADQAHVVVGAQTKNNDWAFTLWLTRAGSEWRVLNFHVGVSGIVGHTPEALVGLARQEREAGHPFNAAIVLATAQGLVNRGPAFQLGVVPAAQAEVQKLQLPAELQGKPPFTWTMQGQSYTVADAGLIGVGKEIGILIVLPQTTWTDEHDVDAKNRAFINAFIATHPDYSRVFNFIVARAVKPDNSSGFATVYENGKGFVKK